MVYQFAFIFFLTIIFPAAAMETQEQETQEPPIVAAMVQTGLDTQTIAGKPETVRKKLARLAQDPSHISRVSMLRIEKVTASARSSAANIMDPLSLEQAVVEINKIYPVAEQDTDNQQQNS